MDSIKRPPGFSPTVKAGAAKQPAAAKAAAPASAPAPVETKGWGPRTARAGGEWIACAASAGQKKLDGAVKAFEKTSVGDNAVGHFAGGVVSGLGSLVTGAVGLVGGAIELADEDVRAKVGETLKGVVANPGAVTSAIGEKVSQAWKEDKAHFAGQVVANLIPAGLALRSAVTARAASAVRLAESAEGGVAETASAAATTAQTASSAVRTGTTAGAQTAQTAGTSAATAQTASAQTATAASATTGQASAGAAARTAQKAATASEQAGGAATRQTATAAQDAAKPLRTHWNPARMAELANSKAEKVLAAIESPDYVGPPMESADAIRAFYKETIPHVYRVRQLVERLGGDATTHDLVERVPLDKVEQLAARLKDDPSVDASWLNTLVARARAKNASELEVGKLSPQVGAGLARAGKPDRVSIELHRLSAHHAPGAGTESHLEAAADVLDALVSPRSYKQGMSFDAAKKIFWDMVEKRQISYPDTAESRTLFDKIVSTYQHLRETEWAS